MGLDLEKIVLDAIAEKLTQDFVKQSVESHLSAMMDKISKELFSSYGKVTKAIEEQLVKAIDMNGVVDAYAYNARIRSFLSQYLDKSLDTSACAVASAVETMLEKPKASVNLSEIVDAYKKMIAEKHSKDDDGCRCDDSERPREIVVDVELSEYGYRHVKLGTCDSRGRRQGQYSGTWYETGFRIDITPQGEVYGLAHGDENICWKSTVYASDSFLMMLWRLYGARSKVVVDRESFDTDIEYEDGE